MITSSIIEMNESEHGLIGLGTIFIHHRKNSIHECYYEIPRYNIKIKLPGEEAQRVFEKSIMSDEFDTSILFRFASDSCGIPIFRINENSRKEEIIFARYLIIWYLVKHIDYSYSKAGKIVKKDRATAIHGFKIIKGEPKYLKPQQRLWRKVFMKKLEENGLI